MSRHKQSLGSFSIDTDFFHDERIVALGCLYGASGPLAALMLLSLIYQRGYWEAWSEPIKLKLCSMLPDSDIPMLEEIVGKLVDWGFFDRNMFDNHGILTSADIQKRYFRVRRRAALAEDLPYYLLDSQSDAAPTAAPIEKPDARPSTDNITDGSRQPNPPIKRAGVLPPDADFDYSLFTPAGSTPAFTVHTG